MTRPNQKESAPEVLVCFAVRQEARPFIALRPENHDRVRTLITGMGRANAGLTLAMALAARRPGMVITAGFAGGLNPKLTVGQVIFDADPECHLATSLLRTGATEGRFHCAELVAVSAADKAKLRKSTGADAVEMESGIIRKLCRTARIPSATVRVISDAANDDLPLDFNALMTGDSRISYLRLGWAVVTYPSRIPALMRFQKQTAATAKKLAEVLSTVLDVQE